MKIVISARAEKQLKKLSKINQIAIAKKIRRIAVDQLGITKRLSGYKNIYRVRVGDYRIVYKKTSNLIYIILIRDRKDVYRVLKRLIQ
jgi:mRNA interferase RelE/StbE